MTVPAPNLQDRLRSLMLWADRPVAGASLLNRALHRLVRLLLIAATEFRNNGLGIRSAAITYTVLLSLVPILAMSTAMVKGFGGGDHLREIACSYIDSLEGRARRFPAGVPENENSSLAAVPAADANLIEQLRSAVDQFFGYVEKADFAAIGTFGLAGILLSAMLVLSNIEAAMNTIWKVAAGRSPLRRLADYLTLLILMPLSINIGFAASVSLKSTALAPHIDKLIPFAWLQTLLLKALPVVVIAFTLYVIYIFFPNTRVRSRPAMLGATLAAALWFGIQNLYISLQFGLADYNAIYGSFATVPLFLAWIYLGWIFILAGAQLAFAAQAIGEHRLMPIAAAPSLQLAAAFDIMECIFTIFRQNGKLTLDRLIELLPDYPPQIVSRTVSVLRAAGIVHLSRNDERLLPAMSREQYRPEELICRIFGRQAPNTTGGRLSKEAIKAAAEAVADSATPAEMH